MPEFSFDPKQLAVKALSSEDALIDLVKSLEGASRRSRQASASALAMIARENAELLVPYINALVDGLNRPEAQTRWECIDALTLLVPHAAQACAAALDDVESALFDESNGPVRLSSVRFLCKYGATGVDESECVWPLIDEAVQCYHGDLEFSEMLGAVSEFAVASISAEVRQALIDRMSFDATNGKGLSKKKAIQIIESARAVQ